MAPPIPNRFYLRSIHEEIGLYDRKLAHLLKYETFPTDAERTAAAAKLNTKRSQLARTARDLIQQGIEFKESEMPPSLRNEMLAEGTLTAPAQHEAEPIPQ